MLAGVTTGYSVSETSYMSRCVLFLCVLLLFTAPALRAESKNPQDYPLRIHVFGMDETAFYQREHIDETKGEGRADLYENGEVRGLDFSFECPQKLHSSFGYETYPAKWKKPGRELVVLFPAFGRAGSYWNCTLHTDVKDFAYARQNGRLISEPVSNFLQWMRKHNYDPEHGKDMPTPTGPGQSGGAPSTKPPR